jgi:hypothetical protein
MKQQPLEAVRAAEERIRDRLHAATASAAAVAEATRAAGQMLAAARAEAAARAAAHRAGIAEHTEREIESIGAAAESAAARLREHATRRLEDDADLVVAAVFAPHLTLPGPARDRSP